MARRSIFLNILIALAVLCAVGQAWMTRGFGNRVLSVNKIGTATSRISTSLRVATGVDHEELLDEMIYSGDMEGYMRRRSNQIVNDKFLGFLNGRLDTVDDDEEKEVLNEIIGLISAKLTTTDGMGADSGAVFEKRLDKILFTNPNKRLEYIEANKEDMTPGFIEFVQAELKHTEDMDGKVVMASVLSLIGEVQGTETLAEGEKAVLQFADESLGEQFAKGSSLFNAEGLADASLDGIGDQNEQILAGLIFSENDILEDVLNNLHVIKDDFVTFLEQKIDGSQNMEERAALSSLRETVQVVLERVNEAKTEGSVDEMEEELTMEGIKKRMQEVQSGQQQFGEDGKVDTVKEFKVKADKRETFLLVLENFQNLPDQETTSEAVRKNYELCDKEFCDALKAEEQDCISQGYAEEAQQYTNLLAMITSVMSERIGTAQERLQKILTKQSPAAMESEVVAMVRKGEMDEALILLIEVNAQQAEAAGAAPAAALLKKLRQRIIDETERNLPEEQRLLRTLIRETNEEKRKELLYEAFKPTKEYNQDRQLIEKGPPLITPTVFIQIIRQLLSGFANMDGMDIRGKAEILITEAEKVATDLYGEGMTKEEQQRFMFEKNTVSVWDLANFEEQAMMSGEEVPWGNDAFDDKGPDDVIGERVHKVGGGP